MQGHHRRYLLVLWFGNLAFGPLGDKAEEDCHCDGADGDEDKGLDGIEREDVFAEDPREREAAQVGHEVAEELEEDFSAEEGDALVVIRSQLHAEGVVRDHRARPREEEVAKVEDGKPDRQASAGGCSTRRRHARVRWQRAVRGGFAQAGRQCTTRGGVVGSDAGARRGGAALRADGRRNEWDGIHEQEKGQQTYREGNSDKGLSAAPACGQVIRPCAHNEPEEKIEGLGHGDDGRLCEHRHAQCLCIDRCPSWPHSEVKARDGQSQKGVGSRGALVECFVVAHGRPTLGLGAALIWSDLAQLHSRQELQQRPAPHHITQRASELFCRLGRGARTSHLDVSSTRTRRSEHENACYVLCCKRNVCFVTTAFSTHRTSPSRLFRVQVAKLAEAGGRDGRDGASIYARQGQSRGTEGQCNAEDRGGAGRAGRQAVEGSVVWRGGGGGEAIGLGRRRGEAAG